MLILIKSFNELRKNLKKDVSAFPKLKIAVLGDSSTQFLVNAIQGYSCDASLNIEIFESDYDQIDLQIADKESELYRFEPDFIVLFHSPLKLLNKFSSPTLPGPEENKNFADRIMQEIRILTETIESRLKCKIIYFNFPEISDSVFGNYSNKIDFSFTYQLRKINLALMDLSRKFKNLFINDVCLLQSQYGSSRAFDSKIYVNGDIVYSLDFTAIVAKNVLDIILSMHGRFNKCLVLDLDNVLWGGIIGDDGIENIQLGELGIGKAFTELQLWFKQLKQRGVLLAVSSKNDPELAKEPFEKHPDMVLKMDDFAAFRVNWENKADNIKYIKSVLNIGFDSMVFLDDSPFERNLVRNFLPEITVPELPEDPAEYLNYLRTLNLFETSSFSEEDTVRTKQYKQEYRRNITKDYFVNEDEYLASLGMVSECKCFDNFTLPRVAQLTQRSNQFNLRTVRYAEEDIQKIIKSPEYLTQSFTLEDKFGNYGLISLIIMKKLEDGLFLNTWIMSCRVLKRTMENFVLNTIAELASTNGFTKLMGEYIPTAKNKMVKDHYKNLGFVQKGDFWELDLNTFNKLKTFIQKKVSG